MIIIHIIAAALIVGVPWSIIDPPHTLQNVILLMSAMTSGAVLIAGIMRYSAP